MKLRNIINMGRWENIESGTQYNLRKGTKVGWSTQYIYYRYRGTRIFIGDSDFYGKYKKVEL